MECIKFYSCHGVASNCPIGDKGDQNNATNIILPTTNQCGCHLPKTFQSIVTVPVLNTECRISKQHVCQPIMNFLSNFSKDEEEIFFHA